MTSSHESSELLVHQMNLLTCAANTINENRKFAGWELC